VVIWIRRESHGQRLLCYGKETRSTARWAVAAGLGDDQVAIGAGLIVTRAAHTGWILSCTLR